MAFVKDANVLVDAARQAGKFMFGAAPKGSTPPVKPKTYSSAGEIIRHTPHLNPRFVRDVVSEGWSVNIWPTEGTTLGEVGLPDRAGYADPKTKTIHIAGGSEGIPYSIGHELLHAYQFDVESPKARNILPKMFAGYQRNALGRASGVLGLGALGVEKYPMMLAGGGTTLTNREQASAARFPYADILRSRNQFHKRIKMTRG